MNNLSKKDYTFLFTKIGSLISKGVDGYVYEIINEPNKVIKISKNYNNININDLIFNFTYLKNNKIDIYPIVYDFKLIKQTNNYIVYYTILEKCFNISEDEYKVFHSLLSHEDLNKVKNLSDSNVNKITAGLSLGLDYDEKGVKLFVRKIKNEKLKHKDLHTRNIMKDISGNFKLIDLDRLEIKK